ncbi:hypothetical protein FA15DRAFT_671736 [Coprinopsis marcescibilis]|uniref:F-box domain-containing protein n=1 Tax=Coprinopsis marcescibilis TaxID=230819 RepID=A0A5C3KQ16_COPMA|nr:hypothetical protein FA15DRAFT_671736 [Coprinopsis marcescibilis]
MQTSETSTANGDSNALVTKRINLSTVNPQNDSPLYTTFPPEVRRYIVSYVLSAYDDTSEPWSFQSYYRRPGYTGGKRTEVAVLRTCKLMYIESRDLIFQPGTGNEEEAFWWGDHGRRPPDHRPSGFGNWIYNPDVLPDGEVLVDEDEEEEWDDGSFEDDMEEADIHAGQGVQEVGLEGEAQELEAATSTIWYPVDISTQGPAVASSHLDLSADPSFWGPSAPAGAAFESTDSDSNGGSTDDESEDPHGNAAIPSEQGVTFPAIDAVVLIGHYTQQFFHDGPFQSKRTARFTQKQWSMIKKVHIFPQMFAVCKENFIQFFHRAPSLRPSTVHVTIRYTDWWWWENDARLDLTIRPSLLEYYLPESCNTFILELETIESKKKELDDQVKRVVDEEGLWRWKRLDDEYLVLDQEKGVKEREWMGPTTFWGPTYPHHPQNEEMKYVVKVLTFTAKPTEQKELALKSFGEILCMKQHVPSYNS